MIRRLLLLGLLLGLAACETVNLSRDYDSSRDFAAYRSWAWAQPAFEYRPDDPRIKSDLTEQRIRSAVADQLDQRGLRPSQGGAAPDVTVRAYLIVDQRQDQVTTYTGGYWNGYWGGYWGGPAMAESRTVTYKVATIQVDLLDGKDGKLVWRGSGEQIMRSSPPTPAEREAAIRETVQKVLAQYPPRG
ncbi:MULTISPECIES: DUF4136 domain-containing protein [Pseudomonas]|uniref:DUF4136 domain-containing protein n=1 Tax=Pseudomonas TaxID=286 RepID=UPI00072FFCCC|nr:MULTISPECIES: DUF4136 domain-containing protein [Pseudomonas]KSW28042.1 hypothetical protein AOX63_18680 [Pseudomonas sp. ADP]OBP12301.1 hypothetical protein BAE52_05570 [Pseudomonas sp. EGD-AKN5]QOF82296.1 DUF4136 domain-containing protein [Pseudomonas sp. ADPe]WBG65327.1 DUF4136 domain-containing protein [Pseudomonas citronellolis]WRT85482.1 DUF4136 domain-containing protein [Pseudomonas citronellolis]